MHLRWAAPVAECGVCADDFVHVASPGFDRRPCGLRAWPIIYRGIMRVSTGSKPNADKSMPSSAEKPSCDRKPLEGALGMWSLSPRLRADRMGNSMKIRMRFIQNMQWRQQKGCEKKRLIRLRFVLESSLVSKKKKVRGLTPLTCALDGGRYKIRTCDPIRVKDMLYP